MKLCSFIVICCILPALSKALQCYRCNEYVQDDKNCGEKNPDEKYVSTCPEGFDKGCMKASFEKDGKKLYGRECGPVALDECKEEDSPFGKGMVCYCTKDKCNSSFSLSSNLVTFVPMYVLIVYNCRDLF